MIHPYSSFTDNSFSSFIAPKKILTHGMKRCHTCPIEQVLQEMSDTQSKDMVSRLFTETAQEVAFSESLHEIMKLFSKSVIRVSRDLDPDNEDPECLKVIFGHF